MGLIKTRNNLVAGISLPVPAEKIKEVHAIVREIKVEVIKDKVVIQGIIHKQIFFVDLTGIVRHFPIDIPFSTFVDVPGALPEMEAQVEIVIEHIKDELSSDRMGITQKVILEIFTKIVDEVQFNVNLDSTGPLVKVEEVIGENIKQELSASQFQLPVPAIKIVDILTEVQNSEIEVIADKVIIQGIIHKQIFFIDENNLERHIAENIPFNTFIDIPGAEVGDDAQVNVGVELIKQELDQIPGDILNQEIVIEFFAKILRSIQVNVEIDSGPLVKLPFVVGENDKQDLIVSDVCLENPAIKVKEIEVKAQNLRTVLIENKVIVQGTLHKQIFYIDEENIERHQVEDVPFQNFLDIPGASIGNNVDFLTFIEEVIFELRSDNLLHQKVIIQYFIKVTELQQVNVAVGSGPLIKVEEVVGENTKQILIESIPDPEPEPILPIETEKQVIRILEENEIVEQHILTNQCLLPTKATLIKSISPFIRNVDITPIENQILITGEIELQIAFVDLNKVIKNFTKAVSFEFLMNTTSNAFDISIEDLLVEIENLSFELLNDEETLKQTIILKFVLSLEDDEQLEVVTKVTGPDVVATEIMSIVEKVVIPDNLDLIEFGPTSLENTEVILHPPAQVINDILANIENLEAKCELGRVYFAGIIFEEIIYQTAIGIEMRKNEQVPFELFFDDERVRPEFNVPELKTKIDNIDIDVSEDGRIINQIIILTIEFKVTTEEVIPVITDVVGPGIENITKRKLILDIDGQEPTEIEVVTDLEINQAN